MLARERIQQLIELGTRELGDPHAARRVRITNVLALVIGAACVPYVGIFAALGASALAYAVLLVIAGYGLVLYLNHRGFRRVAPVLYTLTATGAVTTYSAFLGEASGIHYLFFSILVVPGLIIASDDPPMLLFAIALPLAGFGLLIATDWSIAGAPVVTRSAQSVIRMTMVPTTAVILLAGVLYFARTTERSQKALDRRNRDMQRILDNVDQGLMSVTQDGTLDPEHSAILETWFGKIPPDTTLSELVTRVDARAAEWLDLGWELLTEAILPLEVCLEQLPKRLLAADRRYTVQYQVVGEPGAEVWDRLMVIITDVTDAFEREAQEVQQREVMTVFRRVMRDRDGVRAVRDEVSTMVAELVGGDGDAAAQQRLLHTVKGNTALFGLESLAELCHELENVMRDTGDTLSARDRERLAATWQGTARHIDELVGAGDSQPLFADPADVTRLLEAVNRGAEPQAIAGTLAGWLREPVRSCFLRSQEQALALAERLHKRGLTVTIDDGGVRLDRERWAPFWSAFAHVVRNAIDHGIELPAERAQGGKPPEGELSLSAREDEDQLHIIVRDDGRGVDWDAVAARARACDLPSASREELVAALFVQGFSTRSDVTATSGRGVGMNAVREATEALGGTIQIASEPGAGTSVTFAFPLG